MWTLFVISMSPYMIEPKVTRYEEYTGEWNCNIALDKLKQEIEHSERLLCMQTGKVIPDVDTLY